MLAIEFTLDVSQPFTNAPAIHLKLTYPQEHVHFVKHATTRIEGKLDNVGEKLDVGFQVCH
jgi:hypothetical protein